MRGRDLISIADLSPQELERVLQTSLALKEHRRLAVHPGQGEAATHPVAQAQGGRPAASLGERLSMGERAALGHLLAGKTLALVFEKPSLRTRVSFDVAMRELGGHCIYLSPPEVGLGEREPVKDVARVLSRYVDCIAARTFAHETVEELARWAEVPVINALSEGEHPCQALADLMTVWEKKGRLAGLTLAFVGDANNVARSLCLGAATGGMHFRIASPPGYELAKALARRAEELARASGGSVSLLREPAEAVAGADVVYTDVWASMGQEREAAARRESFAGYTVDASLMSKAKPDAIFMHDMPAHRGEEVTDEVMEGAQSVAMDQAENRMHAQKGLLALVLGEAE